MKLTRLARCLLITAAAASLVPAPIVSAVPTAPPRAYAKTDQSVLVVKLKAAADAELLGDIFKSNDPQADMQLNKVLASDKVIARAPLLPDSRQTVRDQRRRAMHPLAVNQGDLENYYTLKLAPGETADAVAARLKANDVVEAAYAKPLPAPLPETTATPSYVPLQRYLSAAPTGMSVGATIGGSTMQYPGVYGGSIKVADLEYSWNVNHEDLSLLRKSGALWSNGTPADPFTDVNHGTAVAGIFSADVNGKGVNGIVPNASLHMANTYSVESGWNLSNAIYTTANKMSAGDVMLLEQQAWAPDQLGYAPVEIYQDVYDAIVYATAKGINVIEPAGNGKLDRWEGYNLDDPMFGGIFTTARANSGAIIVGAGGAGNGCSTTPAHARMAFSNYGTRVDVQGYGECVVTTGYGNLYAGSSVNTWYTGTFNGTSSASATIAAAAASLSSSYEAVNSKAMTPAALRAALKTGATAQSMAVAGKIGPLPNLASALRLTDITAPVLSAQLTGKLAATNKISLSWAAATDNLHYVTYNVYRDGVKIATTSNTSYVDNSIRTKKIYAYKVLAADASGNTSAFSNTVNIRNR